MYDDDTLITYIRNWVTGRDDVIDGTYGPRPTAHAETNADFENLRWLPYPDDLGVR